MKLKIIYTVVIYTGRIYHKDLVSNAHPDTLDTACTMYIILYRCHIIVIAIVLIILYLYPHGIY